MLIVEQQVDCLTERNRYNSVHLGTRKSHEVSPTFDINTIDKQQTDEFIIPMPNVLTRRSLFQTDIDPNLIKVDILVEEKFYGSFILSSEDLRMLVNIINFSNI